MDIPKSVKEKLILDHMKLISSILSDGIIIPSKTVRANSASAAVYLPRKYVGYTFKIILLPETDADKALFKTNSALVERDARIRQLTKQMKALNTRIEHLKSADISTETDESTETEEVNSTESEDAY